MLQRVVIWGFLLMVFELCDEKTLTATIAGNSMAIFCFPFPMRKWQHVLKVWAFTVCRWLAREALDMLWLLALSHNGPIRKTRRTGKS